MGDSAGSDLFPALKARTGRPIDRAVDEARRVLWRAFQRGTLNEEEFASTLDRLEFEHDVQERRSAPPKPAGPTSDAT